jgi:hypothetical protein
MRLIELGLRHHIVAAVGACGVDLKFSRPHLGSRDIEGLLRVVKCGAGGVSVFGQLRRSIEGLLGIQKVGLGLRLRLARRGQRQFIKLPHPCVGLGNRALRLHHGGFQFARFQRYQRLTLDDPLAFQHQHVIDGAGNLAADLDPERRLDMAAGDHALHQIAAPDLIDHDGRAPYQPRALPRADAERQHNREGEPFVRPDRGPCSCRRNGIGSRKRNRLFDHFNVIQSRPIGGRVMSLDTWFFNFRPAHPDQLSKHSSMSSADVALGQAGRNCKPPR